MTTEAMIDFLDASADDIASVAEDFESIKSIRCKDSKNLKHCIDEGWFICEIILVNNVKAYRVVWSRSVDNGIWIHNVQAIVKGLSAKICIDALEALVIREKGNYCRFMTTRKGLVDVCLKNGAIVEGLIIFKAY